MKHQFNPICFAVFFGLLITEVLIALYMHDRFIRPIVGDVLVVPLMYFFLRSFISPPAKKLALAVLLFAATIEFFQYLRVLEWVQLQDNIWASTIFGATFDWRDLVAYAVGALLSVAADHCLQKRNSQPTAVTE